MRNKVDESYTKLGEKHVDETSQTKVASSLQDWHRALMLAKPQDGKGVNCPHDGSITR